MLSRIYILISIFTTSLLFAQANTSVEKEPRSALKADGSIPKGNYLNGLNQNLSIFEKSIADKISNLEKLQTRAAELNKSLKEKVFIADEVPFLTRGSSELYVSSRHIEFTFQADKTKELKIVSRKKNVVNDMHSIIRTLTFTPGDLASIRIKVDKFDSKIKGMPEVEEYNNMPPEAKLVALKAIDLVLYNTIFRFDTLIQKAEITKVENIKNNLTEL